MANEDQAGDKRLCVLKFGSSVLGTEADYPAVALEIYRHVRDGEKVVAVVSALAGQTDSLLDQAERVGGAAPDGLVARLARVGELHSAALMALALSKVGVRACTMDPDEMGLVAEGDPLDSNLVALDSAAVWAKLDAHEVVVVPGFTAQHAEHGVVTLGRGGTDLSAVFFAARLDAHRVRLIKDVDGVYAEDPAKNPNAERFSQMSYAEATEASSGLIQPKAIRAAEAEDVLIEVAALGSAEATTIAHLPAVRSCPPKPERLRVALLGCGAVGAGVLTYLHSRPDLFEVNPVLVRRPAKYGEPGRYTAQLTEALAGKPDLVVELLGGADHPAELMLAALHDGAQVVTANKAAVAKHYDSLHACAEAGGGAIRYSAAVGGGAPILETLARLEGDVVAVEGVMNGTCNYLLSRLAEGWTFDDAVRQAQELGYAEADPAADVDSHDAADKLSVLIREAFGVALLPDRIAKESLRDVTPEAAQAALARGEVLKQVGRCRLLEDGSIAAEVRVVALPAAHPLAGARNEENRFLVTDTSGKVHEVFGKGAGRWPTATAVFADVMDAQRALLGRVAQAATPTQAAPLKLLA
ncbi:homoserine dehydrogenase [Allosphingosinicella deserti]|uniref:Homoserine dehydrogenase n=1 Tax=Allosphingosinicella deserti TaxID=2116704 RepID=A0A2P7QFI1_9SPHN|nr:homoserine dehydrogenase [Sphingomonas deserti]PSJ36738.1 aspartate kinase [Sphingomonas deserti]